MDAKQGWHPCNASFSSIKPKAVQFIVHAASLVHTVTKNSWTKYEHLFYWSMDLIASVSFVAVVLA